MTRAASATQHVGQEPDPTDELFRLGRDALLTGRVLLPTVPASVMQAELLKRGLEVPLEEIERTQPVRTVEDHAAELLDSLLLHLELGTLTPCMLAVLAQHIRSEQAALGRNAAGMKILGIGKASRPRSRLAKEEAAMLAFSDSIDAGSSEHAAMRNAYDAYGSISEPPQRYELDISTPRVGKHPTLAHQRMEAVRAVLVRAGLLKRRKPGRPSKSK